MTQPPPSPHDHDAPSARPLEYAKAEGTSGSGAAMAIAGAVTGIAFMLITGFLTIIVGGQMAGRYGPGPALGAAIGTVLLILTAPVIAVGVMLVSRQRRRWFLAGFCLAAGILCLLEGICFTAVN